MQQSLKQNEANTMTTIQEIYFKIQELNKNAILKHIQVTCKITKNNIRGRRKTNGEQITWQTKVL